MTYSNNDMNLVALAMQEVNTERILRERAEAELEAQRNKVLFADAASASSESILVEDMALILKQSGVDTGRERLYEWLRGNGYAYRQACGNNRPTQLSLDLGIMEVKHVALINAYGKVEMRRTLKITPKGIQYFFDKVMAEKDSINAIEAEKKAAKRARDNEVRREKRRAEKEAKQVS